MRLGDIDAKDVWRELRATRHSPPGRATSGVRKTMYTSALEQAAQMFVSAAVSAPEIRPVQAFYGLSQAGRAIAAAATSLDNQDYKLTGHGIKAVNLDGDLLDIRCIAENGDRTSFRRVSQVLGSPLWTAQVSMVQLWECLPPVLDSPPRPPATDVRHPLEVFPHSFGEAHPLATATIMGFPQWLVDQQPDRQGFIDHLQRSYPAADAVESFERTTGDPDAGPQFRGPDTREHYQANTNWQFAGETHLSDQERREYFAERLADVRGSLWLLPAPDGLNAAPHPLMAWWAVLHTLSMLARYHPERWSQHIDPDRSSYAVPIEHLLDRALVEVPDLVLGALRLVSRR